MLTREDDRDSGAARRMARLQGRTMAAASLLNLCACGEHAQQSEDFAAGMLDGVRDWLEAQGGSVRAYGVIQSVADGVSLPLLQGQTTAEPRPKPRHVARRAVLAFWLLVTGARPC